MKPICLYDQKLYSISTTTGALLLIQSLTSRVVFVVFVVFFQRPIRRFVAGEIMGKPS